MAEHDARVTEDELHASVDGELAADRREAVEAWLATHPEDAARVAAWRGQADLVRAQYGRVVDEPLPPRLQLDRLARDRWSWRRLAAAAAVLVAFVAGAGAGWFGRAAWEGEAPPVKTLTAEAIEAHKLYIVEVRHPVEVLATEGHLVRWLSKRVGHELRAPDLDALGLKLIGGRLLPGPNGAAAFFMYEGRSGERYTLYCAHSSTPDSALRYTATGPVAAFYWVDRQLAYVLSGPAERERLHQVAAAAYGQLESVKSNPDSKS